MGRIARLARRAAAQFIPSLGRDVVCGACGLAAGAGVRMVAGPRVYLCSNCFERAARQLAPKKPPADGVRCRFCRQLRSPQDVTRVDAVTICGDCLGLIQAILNEADEASRPAK
jgi:hypothetical protein